jgi:CRISPR-associated endonuclease/helicase Cas3
LCEHAKNVADISISISRFSNTSKLIAYLHDIGKLSDDFQKYITNGGIRGSVIHAWQGAFLANELFTDKSVPAMLLKEVIGFCITAHHNNLSDGVSPDGTTNYLDKFMNTMDIKYSFDNIKTKIDKKDKEPLLQLFENAKQEIVVILAKINENYKNKDSANFALGLYVKHLYSCLVDADRLDAYLFSTNAELTEEDTEWNSLIDTFERNISKFPNTEPIDSIRKSVSDKCKAAAKKETGIYQLSVPTGGGKTLSSLRFALHHCKELGKKRIIYVIPYLSIIEQTAKNIRNILNLTEDNAVVFEHHSNIMEQEDESAAEIRALTSARWDSPIIITTMVQFLETVMSSKGGKLRKFAHMADSVLIFDEIQSMPIKAIHCFNEVISFLSKILNSTVILCSATQPTLESTQRANLLLAENPKLIYCTDDFKDIKRVKISIEPEKDTSSATGFIIEKASDNGNCLVIVNTKKSALDIFNLIRNQNSGFEVLHLSTSMCTVHRIEVIDTIKKCLAEGKKVICISTQLIEAGVDLSFSCVIRAMAGLDSIAQAAGRCNRNGESIEAKVVYTFILKDENLDKLPDIKSGKDTTAQISIDKTADMDLLDETIMTSFYKNYFHGKDSQMDYPIGKNETVYAMLSSNCSGKQNYQNRTGMQFSRLMAQAFNSANMNFCVIDNNTKSVVVLYGEADDLIEQYQLQPINVLTKEKVQIIKKLQRYSVGLYEWQLQKLSKQQALRLLDEETGIIILDKNYYAADVGLVLEIIQDNLII